MIIVIYSFKIKKLQSAIQYEKDELKASLVSL
jgi:hypothetical protein